MLRGRLKMALSNPSIPTLKEFIGMTREERAEIMDAFEKDNSIVAVHFDLEEQFKIFECIECSSKKVVHQKTHKTFFANFCRKCSPKEKQETKKHRTFEDIFQEAD